MALDVLRNGELQSSALELGVRAANAALQLRPHSMGPETVS